MDTAIPKRLELLSAAQAEYKIKKEMLQEALKNDSELPDLEEKKREATRRFTAQKQAILNEPENRKLLADMKDLALEIKETKQLLADELVAYFLESNSLEYTDPSGMKRRFKVSAQFVREGEES